jgi:hypothetical protein
MWVVDVMVDQIVPMREVEEGLAALFGVGEALKALAQGGGEVALAERGEVRWWLEAKPGGEWVARLDWEPQDEALRPKGVKALMRWRGWMKALEAVAGVGLEVEADAQGRVIVLRFPCAQARVFEAAARLDALTRALTRLVTVGDAADVVASDAGEAAWVVLPTVGRLWWVDGHVGEAALLADGALLLVLSAEEVASAQAVEGDAPSGDAAQVGAEEVLAWGLGRRFGVEVERVEVAPWARGVAAALGVLRVGDEALLRVRWPSGEGAGRDGALEVLRLIKGLRARWRRGGWEAVGRLLEVRRDAARVS